MKTRQQAEVLKVRVIEVNIAGPYPQKIRKFGSEGLRYKVYINGVSSTKGFVSLTSQFIISEAPDGHRYVVNPSKLFSETKSKCSVFVDLNWGNYYNCLIEANSTYEFVAYENRLKSRFGKRVYFKIKSYERIVM